MKDALGLTLGALLDIPFDSRSPMQREAIAAAREALAQPEQEPCGGCGGSGWVPRDPDIGTEQECFDCNGSGAQPKEPVQEPLISKDAYDGAREDLAIWKKRALEAEQLNRKFFAEVNGPTLMGEPAPLPVQPEQEPVATTYKEVTDAMNLLLNGDYKQVQMAQLMADAKLYTAPPKRPWVGLTDDETETLIHRFDGDPHTLLDEVNARLKEKNA